MPQIKNTMWRLARIDVDGKRGAESAGTPRLWQFCASGTYEMRQGTAVHFRGTHEVTATTLTMTDSQDGSKGAYKIGWDPAEKLMSLTEGRVALQLAFHDAKDCSQ